MSRCWLAGLLVAWFALPVDVRWLDVSLAARDAIAKIEAKK
jgi:hypothetical protein